MLALILGIVATAAALATLLDFAENFRITRTRNRTTKIFWPIRYGTVLKKIEQLREQYSMEQPSVVIGVHYGGMVFASEIARHQFKPLSMMYTEFESDPETGTRKCTQVRLLGDGEDKQRLKGKIVWLVDNQIHTGSTMQKCKEEVQALGARDVRTIVVHRNGREKPIQYRPNVLLFRSRRKLPRLVR